MEGSPYTFRLANEADKDAIVQFMNTHWEMRHPLVNLPDFFDYYYRQEGGALRFALALQGGRFAAIAGYIPANRAPKPDIWVSIWVADKQAQGSGLELMAALPALTGCRTLACNNIRANTRPFYTFLGYTTGRLGHYYRLAKRPEYRVAKPQNTAIPPVAGGLRLCPLATEAALVQSGFAPPLGANPYKDMWYIVRRYYHFPRQTYHVWGVCEAAGTPPLALLVTRTVPVLGTAVVRIVDYIGPAAPLAHLGPAVDALLAAQEAEYADLYCTGLPEPILLKAGFTPRAEGDATVIPNYLCPPLIENTEYYYFTSAPDGFTMFRADGDQDRPNIQTP